MTKDQKLAAIWKATHADYKGVHNGEKSILVLRSGGTTIVPLSELTDAEIERHLPRNGGR